MKKVLVTGASGYIAKHIIVELGKIGYSIRGTVRDLDQSDIIKSDVEEALKSKINIEFVKTSLNSDEGWIEAAKGCDIILHTASPFPAKQVKNENDLILPAKEGTLRVLDAALKNSISRVIITSSNAAVYGGNKHISEFDENIWTNIDSENISAYTKSKTIAEKAAWEFASQNPSLKITTINPVLVWGPGIGNHLSSASLNIFKMIMKKEMPIIPRMKVPLVDVRDVANAHINAMDNEDAIGKRFLLCENTYWMKDVSGKMKELGYNSPTLVAPDFLIKLFSIADSTLKETIPFLGYDYRVKSNQAKKVLRFNPIKFEKTLKDTGQYLDKIILETV